MSRQKSNLEPEIISDALRVAMLLGGFRSRSERF